MECDSSGNDIDVVLMREGRPVSFESHPIKGKNLHKPIYEKEMLAILLKEVVSLPNGKTLQSQNRPDILKYFLEQRLSLEE